MVRLNSDTSPDTTVIHTVKANNPFFSTEGNLLKGQASNLVLKCHGFFAARDNVTLVLFHVWFLQASLFFVAMT